MFQDKARSAGGGGSPDPAHANEQRADSGLFSLAVIAGHYRIAADPFQIAHDSGLGTHSATGEDIVRAATRIGLKARLLHGQQIGRLETAPLPAIIGLADGSYRIVVTRMPDGRFRIANPLTRTVQDEAPEAVEALWSGEMILVARRWGGAGTDPANFGFKWFLPSIWRYRRPLSHVLIASLFIQVFALITPLFFQLVIDKVLVHQSQSTLIVVVVGLVAIGLFDTLLQYVRSYVLNHTTSRIDVELGSRLFDHLLRLPLAYFETRPAG